MMTLFFISCYFCVPLYAVINVFVLGVVIIVYVVVIIVYIIVNNWHSG